MNRHRTLDLRRLQAKRAISELVLEYQCFLFFMRAMLRVLIMILGKDLSAVLDERGGWRKFWYLRSHIVEQEVDSTAHYTQGCVDRQVPFSHLCSLQLPESDEACDALTYCCGILT